VKIISEATEPSTSKSIQTYIAEYFKQEGTVLKHCVGLAITGDPFARFNDPDMKALTSLALKGAGEKGNINSQNVRAGVEERARKLRQEIINRMKGRQLSISADFGSRNGLDFLGNALW
jgi:hypothetical protein